MRPGTSQHLLLLRAAAARRGRHLLTVRVEKIVIQLCSRHAWPLIMLTSCSQPSSSMKPSELYPAAPIRRRARSRLGFALPPLLAPRLPVLQLRCSSCNRSSKRTAPRGQDEIRFFHFVCIYNNNVTP